MSSRRPQHPVLDRSLFDTQAMASNYLFCDRRLLVELLGGGFSVPLQVISHCA